MNITSIDVVDVNQHCMQQPPAKILARVVTRRLKMDNGHYIEVFEIHPIPPHSENEQDFIRENFPFFHRRILSSPSDVTAPIGGYLLSPINAESRDDSFSSYFSSAKAILTPQ